MAMLMSICTGCGQVMDPAGPVSAQERIILLNSMAIMLAIVVPTIVATVVIAWWFRTGNRRAKRQPEFVYSGKVEMVTWSIPLLTILFLGGIAWIGSFSLEPSEPVDAPKSPVEIQVVALDWKWLFTYPEQGVASVNRLVLPVGQPVRFRLTSASVLNSFFVPRLGSMIYVMNGSVTQLNLRADQPGRLLGLSTHFSGDGFSDMRFDVDALPQEEFTAWAETTRKSEKQLDRRTYNELAQQSMGLTPFVYGKVEPGLFEAIVNQKIPPGPGPIMPPVGHEPPPGKG